MSKDLNKVQLIGRLGQDPEIKYMASGDPVCNISLATGESWKDKNSGEKKSKTEWHRVVIFGKLAEVAGEYLRKGSQVYFEGKLQTREWEDKDGNKRYTTEVVLNGFDGTMQMLGDGSKKDRSSPAPEAGQTQKPQPKKPDQDAFDGFYDDIPF